MRDGMTGIGYYVSAIGISSLLLPFIFIISWIYSVCGCVEFNGGCIDRSAFATLTSSLASIVLGGVALLLCAKGLSVRRAREHDEPAVPPDRKMDRWFIVAFLVSLIIYILVWWIFIGVANYVATVPPFC